MATPKKEIGFADYVKAAFINHWNLLIFGGASVAAVLSGHADVALPLVIAGEITYLAGLTSQSKFQKYVRAAAHKKRSESARDQMVGPKLEVIVSELDLGSRQRFVDLRQRCENLQSLSRSAIAAHGVRDPNTTRTESINRMLWVFLKLLYSRDTLSTFIESTNEDLIKRDIKRLEKKITKLGPAADDLPNTVRKRHSLNDTLKSANLRLKNYARAVENVEYIEIEINRIDSKITSIAELAVNRQDAGFISTEVDSVTATIASTEAAIQELHLLDKLGASDAPPPAFLEGSFDIE